VCLVFFFLFYFTGADMFTARYWAVDLEVGRTFKDCVLIWEACSTLLWPNLGFDLIFL